MTRLTGSAGPSRHRHRARAVLCGSMLLAGLALTGCSDDGADGGPRDSAGGGGVSLAACPEPTGLPGAGAEVPAELVLPCLGGDGELTLGQTMAVPSVVTLWASWCGPCREELPLFEQLAGAADPGALAVLGVNARDSPEIGADLAADLGLSFPSGVDENGDLMVDLGIANLPVTLFLDAGGSVVARTVAPVSSYEELTGLVAEHLGVAL